MKVLQVIIFIATGFALIWGGMEGGYGLGLAALIVTYLSTVVIPEGIAGLVAKKRRNSGAD